MTTASSIDKEANITSPGDQLFQFSRFDKPTFIFINKVKSFQRFTSGYDMFLGSSWFNWEIPGLF